MALAFGSYAHIVVMVEGRLCSGKMASTNGSECKLFQLNDLIGRLMTMLSDAFVVYGTSTKRAVTAVRLISLAALFTPIR